MMEESQLMVTEFHRKFNVPVGFSPKMITEERKLLRLRLINEELQEYSKALAENNIIDCADALGDLLYVVYGSAVEHGFNMFPIMEEIQRSNMSKLDKNGNPIMREDGKILKGNNFTPPDIEKILTRQGFVK